MNALKKSVMILVIANDGNPVMSTLVVMLFFVMFNSLEAAIETLLFGERFIHWIDIPVLSAFIAYAAYAVLACAEYKMNNRK